MREARSSHEDMGWILVIDRRKYAPFLQRPSKIDRLSDPAVGDELAERNVLGDRLALQVERRARADGERPLAVLVDELRQSHAVVLSSASAPSCASISAKIRRSVKSLTVRVAPASISVREASVVVMPTTTSPAATAERTPDSESSKASERLASAPVRSNAVRYGSGSGLARASSAPITRIGRRSPIPNAASTFSALARGAFVTTARLSLRRSAKSGQAAAPAMGSRSPKPAQ